MRHKILATMLVALVSGPTLAQQAFTTEDLLKIEDLSDPVFAPDSETIVYVVTAPGEGDAKQSDLWQVNWKQGEAQPIQATLDRDESSPDFSKDGRILAFLRSGTDDNETAQLWVSENGATARRVSELPGGVDAFSLSPDGRSAVVASEVGENVGRTPEVPVPIVVDRLQVKQDGRDWLDDRRSQLFRIDLASGAATQITSGDFDNWMPSWSPDGQWIAFVSRRCERADMDPCSDVYIVPPTGGEPRRISLSNNADADPANEAGGPQWSPDSRSLVWVRAGEAAKIWYTPAQLVIADIASGINREVAWIDRWFYTPRWSVDGRSILALIEQDRDTWLARIDPAGDQITYLTGGKRFAYDYAEAPDGRIAVLDGDSNTPTQLRTLERKSRILSPQNSWVANRQLAQTQDVSFMVDGFEIHGQLLLPPDHRSGDRHSLVVRLHGGPVYQFSHEFMADWQVFAASGYAVLGINPRGSSGRGAAFAQAQMAQWGGPDVRDIMGGIDHVIGLGVADENAIGVGGWSYGGLLTNYMIASDPRIKAAVSGAGMANFFGGYGVDQYVSEYTLELGRPWENVDRWMRLSYPFFHADKIKAPTLFLCADADWNVPCTGSQQLYTAIHDLGVPTRLVIYPGENHGLTVPSYIRDRMDRSVAWFDYYLRGKGEPPLGK